MHSLSDLTTQNLLWILTLYWLTVDCKSVDNKFVWLQLIQLKPKNKEFEIPYMMIAIQDEEYKYINSQVALTIQYRDERWSNQLHLNYQIIIFTIWFVGRIRCTTVKKHNRHFTFSNTEVIKHVNIEREFLHNGKYSGEATLSFNPTLVLVLKIIVDAHIIITPNSSCILNSKDLRWLRAWNSVNGSTSKHLKRRSRECFR